MNDNKKSVYSSSSAFSWSNEMNFPFHASPFMEFPALQAFRPHLLILLLSFPPSYPLLSFRSIWSFHSHSSCSYFSFKALVYPEYFGYFLEQFLFFPHTSSLSLSIFGPPLLIEQNCELSPMYILLPFSFMRFDPIGSFFFLEKKSNPIFHPTLQGFWYAMKNALSAAFLCSNLCLKILWRTKVLFFDRNTDFPFTFPFSLHLSFHRSTLPSPLLL